MHKNGPRACSVLLAGSVGGVLGFAVTWLVIERAAAGESWPLVPNGAWYGVGVGVGATLLYGACGGRALAGAAGVTSLAATVVTLGFFTHLVASEAPGDDLGGVLLGSLFVFWYWVVPLGLLLLVLPAVTTAVALEATAALVRLLVARPRKYSRRT